MDLFQLAILVGSIISTLAVIGGVIKIAYDTGGIVNRLKQLEREQSSDRLDRIRVEAALDKRLALAEAALYYTKGKINGERAVKPE